jgi:hypothetical protein
MCYSNKSWCSSQASSDCTKVLVGYERNNSSTCVGTGCIYTVAFTNAPARPGSSRLNIEVLSLVKKPRDELKRHGIPCGTVFANATAEGYVKL